MANATTRGWIEAGKAFAIDADADVMCPVCLKGKLCSEDVALPNGELVERRLYCTNCGSENFMRLGPKVER